MDFALDQKQLEIQKKFREVMFKEIAPRAAATDAGEKFPEDNWKALAECGYLGLALPSENGGGGANISAVVIAAEELSAACASTAICAATGALIPGIIIAKHGAGDIKTKWLPAIASGKAVGAYAIYDPAGGHFSDIAAVAEKTSGGYEITGSKGLVTNAARADVFIVFAKTDGKLSAFLVEKGSSGISIGEHVETMGMRGAPVADVHFDKSPASLIGAEGQGEAIALELLDVAMLHTAVVSVGISRAAYEEGKKRAETRVSGGKPIGAYQEVSFKVADLFIEADTARQLVNLAAWNMDEGSSDARTSVSVAKLYASETSVRNANRAVQIFGGAGYTKSSPVERLYRDAKYTEICDGTSEIQRMLIAEDILKD